MSAKVVKPRARLVMNESGSLRFCVLWGPHLISIRFESFPKYISRHYVNAAGFDSQGDVGNIHEGAVHHIAALSDSVLPFDC